MKICCITNDVEHLAINGDESKAIAEGVVYHALPSLLQLYKKHNVHATFYCLASFIEQYPIIVQMIQEDGHEIACHGYSHQKDKAFDILSYTEQIEQLQHAKTIIEKYANEPIVSFRAPALRVNEFTPQALVDTGFITDSSIAPQRLDMFMSLGSHHKLQWIKAPRTIYKTSSNNLARKGNSSLSEIGVSAVGLPYIGTLMRISPFMLRLVRFCIYKETNNNTHKVVNFLYHPSEAVEESIEEMTSKHRASNWISHFFSDILRTHLKSRNLGPESITLLEKEIVFWKEHGYSFKTIKEVAL